MLELKLVEFPKRDGARSCYDARAWNDFVDWTVVIATHHVRKVGEGMWVCR